MNTRLFIASLAFLGAAAFVTMNASPKLASGPLPTESDRPAATALPLDAKTAEIAYQTATFGLG